MAVPDFQTLMLPLLQFATDNEEHSRSEILDHLAEFFGLSNADRDERTPRGRQSRYNNRVDWASIYLRKAGLMESTRRGWIRITSRGLEVLQTNPDRIDLRYLKQYPEIIEFRAKTQVEADPNDENETTLTPEEVLEGAYFELRAALAQDLLDKIMESSPKFFEELVVDLLVAMGYGGTRKDAGQALGRTGDGGIDGIIKEDKLGLEALFVQAKRWQGNVGRPEIQKFAGGLEGARARKGVFITTSGFTQDALSYVNTIEKKIVLVDGQQLAQLMIDNNVGVNQEEVYAVKRIDIDYFGEE